MSLALITLVLSWIIQMIYWAIALAGLFGAITALTTREDAYTAGDRYPKFAWVGMLIGSSAAVVTGIGGMPFLSWIGIVLIGVYWFDVRPQIKDILSGNYW
ncbi:hypothetical protein CFREI_01050 [Corynebacterium freiburgense]|nr:hypothetical protein CFREI_01050 [Corynebacterium freiburgense]